MVEPYGCAECGELKGHHGSRYTPNVGYHVWIRPTDQHILARMRFNRWRRQQAVLDNARRKLGNGSRSEIMGRMHDSSLTPKERRVLRDWLFPP